MELCLIPGEPCPRCAGLVVRRHVVTPDGALTEHYCTGCSRTSHAEPERPYTPPRLVLSPSTERKLDRLCRSADADGCRQGVDDSADIALARSVLDAAEIRAMFAVECLPTPHTARD